jgi:hypothetical protein
VRVLLIGLALGLAVGLVVWLASGGHELFLPLVFLPFGLLFGSRRRARG